MGATDKLIQRLEQQSETLAELRRLEEKHRGRICELERKLGDAEREQDIARVEIETLRQERDAARVYDGNTVAQWHQKACEYSAELRAIWTQMMQVDIAFPEEKSLVQSVQILRESHVAARAEIETLRQQLADAQREAVNLQKLHDHLRPRLDAAQGQLTRERLDAEERGREIETLRQERDLAQAALTRERLDAEERNELNSRQQKGGE
jgi:chromosome segregation protein